MTIMKVTVQVPVSPEVVAALGPEFVKAAKRARASAAARSRRELKELMPKDTGELRRRFYVASRPGGLELIWRAPYAELVDLGAPRHVITPRDPGGYLKFPGTNVFTGRTIYTKFVDHPGQVGQFYRLPVIARALQILNEELSKAFQEVRVRVALA